MFSSWKVVVNAGLPMPRNRCARLSCDIYKVVYPLVIEREKLSIKGGRHVDGNRR